MGKWLRKTVEIITWEEDSLHGGAKEKSYDSVNQVIYYQGKQFSLIKFSSLKKGNSKKKNGSQK